MMKFKHMLFALLSLGFFSTAATADPYEDYKICRTVYDTVNYYQGTASCYATSVDNRLPSHVGKFLSQTVGETTSSTVYLTDFASSFVNGEYVTGTIGCVAGIPFSRSEEVAREACYYDVGAICRDNPRLPMCR